MMIHSTRVAPRVFAKGFDAARWRQFVYTSTNRSIEWFCRLSGNVPECARYFICLPACIPFTLLVMRKQRYPSCSVSWCLCKMVDTTFITFIVSYDRYWMVWFDQMLENLANFWRVVWKTEDQSFELVIDTMSVLRSQLKLIEASFVKGLLRINSRNNGIYQSEVLSKNLSVVSFT